MAQPLFHLAFPVSNLEATKDFFIDVLGCSTGRQSERWIDFDFFGHQVVAHLAEDEHTPATINPVDGNPISVSRARWVNRQPCFFKSPQATHLNSNPSRTCRKYLQPNL